jgi:hypothetical protein
MAFLFCILSLFLLYLKYGNYFKQANKDGRIDKTRWEGHFDIFL